MVFWGLLHPTGMFNLFNLFNLFGLPTNCFLHIVTGISISLLFAIFPSCELGKLSNRDFLGAGSNGQCDVSLLCLMFRFLDLFSLTILQDGPKIISFSMCNSLLEPVKRKKEFVVKCEFRPLKF